MSSSSWFLVQLTFEVASRFYDQLFAHNSSDWQNLTCARLKPDTRTADFPEWDISHGTCRTEWDARGLTCVCKQPGTYALLWSKKGEEVSEKLMRLLDAPVAVELLQMSEREPMDWTEDPEAGEEPDTPTPHYEVIPKTFKALRARISRIAESKRLGVA